MADTRTAETIDWPRYARLALAEDCAAEDATTLATVDQALVGTAIFLAKEPGVLAGITGRVQYSSPFTDGFST